jgi:hypothetical protein
MPRCSYIPEEQWTRLAEYCALPSQTGLFPSLPRSGPTKRPLPRLQAVIIDVGDQLLTSAHTHIGLPHAIAISRRLGALRTYLTDFSHGPKHQTWLDWCLRFGQGETSGREKYMVKRQNSVVPAWRPWFEGEKPPVTAARTHEHDSPEKPPTGLNDDPEVFIRRAFESVEDWAGGVLPGRWVRPAFDGLKIEWQRWGDGRSGVDWCVERVRDDGYR